MHREKRTHSGNGLPAAILKRYFLVITVFLVLIVGAGCRKPASSPEAGNDPYGGSLFDTSEVHTVDIRFSPGDWEDLLKHPEEKIKYRTDVTIDGEEIHDVSCSTKGNSSLKMVQETYGIDRYSLKLNFSKYEKDQNFHGIEKVNLNNNFLDSTCMKDYLCYSMFNETGVDAPLCSYAWVTVNGKDYGLFLVVEEVDENFLERIGRSGSVLYKPDSEKLDAGGEELDKILHNGVQIADYSEGAELSYRGESIADYPDIFNNAETKSDDEDKKRVIRALKGLSEGKDLAQYLDTDELVRYFAVQNFVVNPDGYSGSMLHNYYLCEKDGRLEMLPWDYNLAFAGRWAVINPEQSDPGMLANYGIDTPLLGAEPEMRPMWNWIPQNEIYKQNYHDAMDALLKVYFESGKFEAQIDTLIEQLRPYVEKDPTSFTAPERFVFSAQALRTFCLLRAESIRRQLDGKLASETGNQRPEDRVDASMIATGDFS